MKMDRLNHEVIERVILFAVVVFHLQKLFTYNQEKYQILLAFDNFLKPQDILLNMW